MSASLCVICGVRPVEKRPAVLSTFCRPCASSYDTDGGGDGSVMDAILWAAKRARAGALDRPGEAARRRREEDPERRERHERTQAALGPRNKPSRYGSGQAEEITAPAGAKRVQLPDGDTLDLESGKRSRGPAAAHVAVVSLSTYQRGNRTWRIRCSCGWAWDSSVKGTRRREVEARARSHEREANATPKASPPVACPSCGKRGANNASGCSSCRGHVCSMGRGARACTACRFEEAERKKREARGRALGFEPDWVSPPGETIEEMLVELGLSVAALTKVCRPAALLSGETRIDAGLAGHLVAVVGGTFEFWINRDRQYVADCERLGIKPGSPQRAKDPPTSPEVQAIMNRDMARGRRRSRVLEAAEARLPECPRCRAFAGDPCRGPSGGTCAPHRARVNHGLLGKVKP